MYLFTNIAKYLKLNNINIVIYCNYEIIMKNKMFYSFDPEIKREKCILNEHMIAQIMAAGAKAINKDPSN